MKEPGFELRLFLFLAQALSPELLPSLTSEGWVTVEMIQSKVLSVLSQC